MNLDEPSSVDFLIDLLEGENQLFREIAFGKLKQAKVPHVPCKIAKLFRSKSAYVRNAAMLIMACLWDISREELARLLTDDDKDVRKLALDSLHHVGSDPIVIDLIARALDDPDVNNKITAVEYISEIGSSKYKEKIEEIFLSSDNEFLSIACMKTLAEIGDHHSAKLAMNVLRDLERIDDVMLFPCLRLIARFPETIDIDFLMKIAQQKWKLAFKEIIDAFNSFLGAEPKLSDHQRQEVYSFFKNLLCLDIPSPNRYEILILLSKLDPHKMAKEVISYLYNPCSLVQMAAVEIVEMLNLRELQEDLQKIRFETKDEDLRIAIDFALEQLRRPENQC